MAKEAIKRAAEAERQADELMHRAKAEAAEIIEKAKRQAEEIIADAERSAKQQIAGKRLAAERSSGKERTEQLGRVRESARNLEKNTESRRNEAIRLVIDTLVS